jgi:hypothetical protein
MELLTALASAIALGAAKGTKQPASQAIADAYKLLRNHLEDSYPSVDLWQLERDPHSPARRALLAEELNQTQAERDPVLICRIDDLLRIATENHSESNVAVILKHIQVAKELVINDVAGSGGGVVGESWTVGGSIRISNANVTQTSLTPALSIRKNLAGQQRI